MDLFITIRQYAFRNDTTITLDEAIEIIETVGEEASIEELEDYLKETF